MFRRASLLIRKHHLPLHDAILKRKTPNHAMFRHNGPSSVLSMGTYHCNSHRRCRLESAIVQSRNFTTDNNEKEIVNRPNSSNNRQGCSTKKRNKNKQPRNQLTRSCQQKSLRFLDQVDSGRIQPSLVTQKAEEHLLLFLSERDDNVPADGRVALE